MDANLDRVAHSRTEPPARVPTASMCHVCFAEIPAMVARTTAGPVRMTKTCPAHGTSEVVVERDAAFCRTAVEYRGNVWTNSPACLVEVTHRCNNRCPNCYHVEDRGLREPTVDELVGRVASIPARYICLMGGEPTVRPDLPEIIRPLVREGREVSLYTNGIRYAEPGFADRLADAGLTSVAFSVHHPEYSHPSIYRKKLLALENLRASRLRIDHCSFSLQHDGQIPGILDFIEQHRDITHHFRIRSAYQPEEVPWFVSDLYRLVKAEADRRGKLFLFYPGSDNTRYQVGFLYDGIRVWLMSWPSNIAIDLRHARGNPTASFVDGITTHFCRVVCIQDGLRRGWFAGRRIDAERPAAKKPREAAEAAQAGAA